MPKVMLALTVLLMPACSLFQAAPEIQILKPAATRELRHWERKTTGVARSAVAAWRKSETKRIMTDHHRELADFAAANPGKFTPLYVKAQTAILLDKLGQVRASARGVEDALTRGQIHMDRAIQILDLFQEWMSTGLTRGDAAEVKAFFEEASEKWLQIEKDKLLIEMEKKVAGLESALEEATAEKPPE